MTEDMQGYPRQSAKQQEEGHDEWCPPLDPRVLKHNPVNRRAALRMMGMSALAVASGCGTSGKSTSSSSSDSSTTATTTTLSASATSVAESTAITLTATVSPSAATGTVKFYDSSTSLGSGTLSSGTATLSTSFSTAGTQSLTATYEGSTDYASSTSSAVSVTVTASGSSCSETLEGEEGPYFVDDSASGYNRSNILTNLDGTSSQTGVAFTITLYVLDSENSCTAMENVQVDIWHCNASGIYSAESSESTSSESWLRGYQLTDSTGKVSFTTILPGWYSGRTTHIHFRLRSSYDDSSDGGTNTMQVFFDQDLIDTLATSVSPYDAEGTNSTTNATDRVYSEQEDGTTLLTLSGSNSAGYTASFNIHLPITTAS